MKEKRFAGGIYYFDVVAALIGVVLVLGRSFHCSPLCSIGFYDLLL